MYLICSILVSGGVIDIIGGQLGSGDPGKRSTPQENRWLTKFMTKQGVEVAKICCGGYHNLVLTKYAGQIISWGAGDYGYVNFYYCIIVIIINIICEYTLQVYIMML